MFSNTTINAGRSPLTVAAGFLGAFIVGSLAVQLVRTQGVTATPGVTSVEPVIASPATLWADLGARDLEVSSIQNPTPAAPVSSAASVKPVVASEATLWAPFGER